MADRDKKKTGEKAKTAVALSYMPGDAAPKILATGKGAIAERIIETAKEADVPTYKDDKLEGPQCLRTFRRRSGSRSAH